MTIRLPRRRPVSSPAPGTVVARRSVVAGGGREVLRKVQASSRQSDPYPERGSGQRLAALVTGHPDRRPADLVLLSDVAAELGEMGQSFERLGLDWEGVVEAV